VVVVPSLINAPSVLDLAPGRSLLRFLGEEGFRVLLVRWGPVDRAERRLGLAGLVSVRLLPLLATLSRPVHLVGYCLGGTLALGAAVHLGGRLRSLSLIATPWHFDGFDPTARRDARDSWNAIEPVGRFLGAVPVSLLNPLFWRLDEAAVVAKFRKLGTHAPQDPHVSWFAAVEDWANSGAPLPIPAARDLFVHGFARDRIGRGRWRVAGRPVRPEDVPAPILDIGATGDRIVPPRARLRRPGIARRDVPAGHVGMVVGSSAPQGLWKPLSTWLGAH
jgi:polyhydroxyalkanoate synthase